MIQADPIADMLRGGFDVDRETISYFSAEEGTSMSIDVPSGTLRSNGVVAGQITVAEPEMAPSLWLDPQTISSLTSTEPTRLPDGTLAFETNDSLKRSRELDLWVNGRPVDGFSAEPQMVGSLLLVPLREVAAELGHDIRVEAGAVSIVRVQDSKIVRLDLATGLVSVNGIPSGVTPDLALADLETLLLPHGAVELMTGTRISLVPGTDRVRVTLDDRLDGAAVPVNAGPGKGDAPFTPEALSYQLSDRGPVRAEFSSRVAQYNSRLTYESAGGLENSEELQPAWASLDVQSLDGWSGSAGDYTDRFRELSGVDVSRVRGMSYREQTEGGGLLAVAAGATLTGAEQISDTANKPKFGGFAGGVRLLSEDGTQEIGASAKTEDDGNTSAFVVSGQQVFDRSAAPGLLETGYVSGDAGYFSTASGTGLDVRARAGARYRLTDRIGATVTVYHDGEKFAEIADDARFEAVFDNSVGARTGGSVSADWRSAKSWQVMQNLSLRGRAAINHSDGSTAETATSLEARLAGRIGAKGPDVVITVDHTELEAEGRSRALDSVDARAIQGFHWGTVQARYVSTDGDEDDRELAVVAIQSNPLEKSLGDAAFVSVAPSATLGWIENDVSVRAGASAMFSTGRKLGDRLTIDGQVNARSSVDPDDLGTQYFTNLQARYRVDARTEFVTSYVDDLDGRKDLSVALRGTILFNEPRRVSERLTEQGLVTGTVFVDLNRDGVRQNDEPGLSGANVKVHGSGLLLAADSDGRFTGQTLKQDAVVLSVAHDSLPLGYRPPESVLAETSVSGAKPANIDIPVVRTGQLSGAVFIDLDENGAAGPADQRLEGQAIQLINLRTGEIRKVSSASFGQYGFENVPPGSYRLRVLVGWQEYAVDIELGEEQFSNEAHIAIPPDLIGVEPALSADPAVEAGAV
ncbi:MAG: carboxypeptidase-like regulatory domain-containing protein [Henriciella sp.]|uniref:hypothetical protein n=1 Tax=Henriciella sp. TaxID=1968823 RepID=UPI003C73F543